MINISQNVDLSASTHQTWQSFKTVRRSIIFRILMIELPLSIIIADTKHFVEYTSQKLVTQVVY